MNMPNHQYPLSTIMHSNPMSMETDEVELKNYFNILLDNRWFIAGITLLFIVVTLIYAVSTAPIYEANMLIHVEEDSPNASKNILSEVSTLFETKKAAIAEMEILRSRLIVAHAVDNLHLDIEVRPKYFPVAGVWIAEHAEDTLSTPGLLGFGGYVWGAEKMDVTQFTVPDKLQNLDFVVTAKDNNQFILNNNEHNIHLTGQVGATLNAATAEGPLMLHIEQLKAKAGAQFYLQQTSRLATIEKIQNSMLIAEQGKQSGVIEVKLRGPNAQRVNNILSEIGREYMHQNLLRKTEEAEKSLGFLNQQLPELKQQLEQSEEKYNAFRNKNGTVDLAEEARISLQQSASAKNRRIELMQKKAELLTRFTTNHPIVEAIDKQLAAIDTEIKESTSHIKTLPMMEQDQNRLTRDIKVNTELYSALSNTAQQLKILSVGSVSKVRLLDMPLAPEKPIKPNRPLLVSLAAVTGLFFGIICAFAKKSLFGGIDDPDKIEQLLGARVVYASIPHSSHQESLVRQAGRHPKKIPLLASMWPEDPAIESLRSFRAALQFSMPQFRNNIVTLVGPTRGLGKSFVSANLAAVIAASGKKVLLIDADMRNGNLHRYFGSERQRGLSDFIAGAHDVEQITRRSVLDNLDFIPTGALMPNRSEALLHLNFGALLEAVNSHYDLVLIDLPPVLAVADPLIIGSHVGAVFLVARAGVTTQGEIHESIKRLNQAGILPHGILFNDLKLRLGGYGYQNKYHEMSRVEYDTKSSPSAS